MIDLRNDAFTSALYASADLGNNPLLQWIAAHKDELLAKNARERNYVLMNSLSKNILAGDAFFLNNLKALLDQAIPLLLAHLSTLPESLQIPQQYLDVLMNLEALDLEDACNILAYWRNLFVIENLKKLHAHANNSGLLIVVIFGAAHIEHIREGLNSAGLTVASDIQALPIRESIKKAKQERIKNGKLDV